MKRSSKPPTKKKAAADIRKSNAAKLQAYAYKRLVEEEMFHAMEEWACSKKGVRHILSLPGREWLWEYRLANVCEDFRVHFHGLERNNRVWQAMSKMASNLDRISKFQKFTALPLQTDYSKFLNETEQRFDMIYFDFKAPWSYNTMRQVEIVMGRGLLKRGGLLRITTCQGDQNKGKSFPSACSPEILGYRDMTSGKKDIPQRIPYGIDRQIMEFCYLLRIKISIISSLTYFSHNHSNGKAMANHSVMFRLA
jgi:hypothetical protein